MSLALGNLAPILALLGALAAFYLISGISLDLVRAVRAARSAKVRKDLSIVLFAHEGEAEIAAIRLGRVPPRILLPMAQRIAADLDGDADVRIHRLVSSTGLIGTITRRMNSRRWRRRAQAAALAPLFADGDERRLQLLGDRHPTVRARAAAHLEPGDVVDAADSLVRLLDDANPAVRFAAQQALLRGDARIVPWLAQYLEGEEGEGLALALEVAATLRDPRLYDAITSHTRAEDPRRRALAAGALSPDASGAFLIGEILADADPRVRAAAAAAAAGPGGEVLCVRIGELLGDESWAVRLTAGQSLARLGPPGALTLRYHLRDADPYARDMARRTLDDISAGEGRPVLPAPVPPDIDSWRATEAAA